MSKTLLTFESMPTPRSIKYNPFDNFALQNCFVDVHCGKWLLKIDVDRLLKTNFTNIKYVDLIAL